MSIATILLALIFMSFPTPVQASSSKALLIQGNEHYRAGEYDLALKAYEEAKTHSPESAEIYFNIGNAHFQKGQYANARQAYEAAALRTKDPVFEARAQFNLGNTAFFEAEGMEQTDQKKAFDQFEMGIRHYKEALRMDPSLNQAAVNIEVTRLRVKTLWDIIEKPEKKVDEEQIDHQDFSEGDRQHKTDDESHRQKQEGIPEQSPEELQQQSDPLVQDSDDRQNGAQQEQKEEGNQALLQEQPEDILLEEKQNRHKRQRALSFKQQSVEKDW
jgi:tetratricopeptide (TPR) repeat protein